MEWRVAYKSIISIDSLTMQGSLTSDENSSCRGHGSHSLGSRALAAAGFHVSHSGRTDMRSSLALVQFGLCRVQPRGLHAQLSTCCGCLVCFHSRGCEEQPHGSLGYARARPVVGLKHAFLLAGCVFKCLTSARCWPIQFHRGNPPSLSHPPLAGKENFILGMEGALLTVTICAPMAGAMHML